MIHVLLHKYADVFHISRVSCQKGPTHHAYAWQIGHFWQDTLDILECSSRKDISAVDISQVLSTDISTTQVRTINKGIYVSHQYHQRPGLLRNLHVENHVS